MKQARSHNMQLQIETPTPVYIIRRESIRGNM